MKESIEFSFKPLNYLIAIGPRLDGKILHIKASSLESLLSMSMRDGETLKAYSDRYWETFNEIDGSYDDMAISTFKAGLPAEHDLRKSLTGKPVTNVRLLMDRIDKYKRIEDD